jgi:hypothetical protein
MFTVLSHTDRRQILLLLAQHDSASEFDVDDLSQVSDSQDIELSLYHNHLPKLSQTGFINWNRETDTISRGPQFEKIEHILDLLVERREKLS